MIHHGPASTVASAFPTKATKHALPGNLPRSRLLKYASNSQNLSVFGVFLLEALRGLQAAAAVLKNPFSGVRAHFALCGGRLNAQISQPDHVVCGGGQREHPRDLLKTAVPDLANPATVFIQPKTSSIRLRFRRLTA